nr:uncharacterized protein LOC109152193 [Ipomoea trifida]
MVESEAVLGDYRLLLMNLNAPTAAWSDYDNLKLLSIEGGSSDHLPILLRINSGDRVRVRRRPRYDNAWGKNAECRNIVEHAWSITQGRSILNRLEECGRRVWGWGSNLDRVERDEFRRCKDQLGSLRGRRDAEGVRHFGEVQNKYLSLLQSQSDHWKQRAKEWWYTMGDQNSKFFHNSVNRKRRRNKIHALRGEDGTMVTGKTQMGVIICRTIAISSEISIGDGDGGVVRA